MTDAHGDERRPVRERDEVREGVDHIVAVLRVAVELREAICARCQRRKEKLWTSSGSEPGSKSCARRLVSEPHGRERRSALTQAA